MTRAIAVGIPDRLTGQLAAVPGVAVEDSLETAAMMLELYPRAAVIYGENLFGDAVTGQPVFLINEQRDPNGQPAVRRVLMLIDHHPMKLDELAWDDPRRLAMQAGIRLSAGSVVDVSASGAWVALDARLDEHVDTPNTGGYTQSNGNDEDGDPT